ncbi:uncharacterized protein LY89DRAFT_702706 [Mollisia scopiformis]|uniref:MOSC domain-containing protein n=1 Tax=Mollisia scopiformis TaxID=149040 RepID=A0A132B455_MOLSC|nr:uncharacterized protein LY89DRAFT_702706 [Mollisia scopiformis]KUJ06799.1 hypothetical protein LY89DRAFT_702706 [Mollisia scopiformis]
MQIAQLWIYPIKSMRGCSVSSAILTHEGFYLDRRFMLLKVTESKLENMHVTSFPQMCLFHPSIKENTLEITYRPPGSTPSPAETIEIPLDPENFENLDKVDVNMHGSPTTAYNMGEKYNAFLSKCFGFQVVLAFWGFNPRSVLGNLPNRPSNQGPKAQTAITKVLSSLPLIGPMLEDDNTKIAFNDCAPYLVISEPSVADVSTRLPEDVSCDLTKFRSNIVVRTSEPAFSEDFWSELTFSNEAKLLLTGNCGRCASLTVDYETGKNGTGKDGGVFKALMSDRRVDAGVKYSPIFGRYGFVGKGGEGKVVSVGDEVWVSGRNEERTRFYWPGLST